MKELKLVYYPNKVLIRQSNPVKEEHLDKIQPLLEQMKKLTFTKDGMGLSACQMGIPLNIFVVLLGGKDLQVFINPEIFQKSKERIKSLEGCLSIPNVDFNLNCRYKEIRIRAKNEKWQEFEMLLDGMNAVSVQHEYDHLSGITLFQRIGTAQRQLKKSQYSKRRSNG